MTPVLLLAEEPNNTGPEFGKASPVGLLIVLLLLIGVFALVWSMNRHLKSLPDTFENAPPTTGPPTTGPPTTGPPTTEPPLAGEAAGRDTGASPP